MSLSFACDSCGKVFFVESRLAGKRVKCTACGAIRVVPTATLQQRVNEAVDGVPVAPSASSTAPSAQPPPAPTVPARPRGDVPPPPPLPAAAALGKMKLPPDAQVKAEAAWRAAWSGAWAGKSALQSFEQSFRRRRLTLWIGAGVGAGVLVAIAALVVTAFLRSRSASGPAAMVFPDRPAMRLIEPRVRFCEVALSGEGPGRSMKLWLYLPAGGAGGQFAPRSLPCVLIAPAGSPLITGMALSDGDRPEHLPYARAGFAVLAFELDGAVPGGDAEQASDRDVAKAIEQFVAAEGGLANARTAMDYVLQKVPEVDPQRVYCTRHSSAATVALQFAAGDARVKGCVAFAPALDIVKYHGATNLKAYDRDVPGVLDFATRSSPANLPTPLCPVMLFHADDDDLVPADDSRAFAARRGPSVTLKIVPSGGHHASMIDEGIPAAIAWLNDLSRRTAAAAVPVRAPTSQSASTPTTRPDDGESSGPETRPGTETPSKRLRPLRKR